MLALALALLAVVQAPADSWITLGTMGGPVAAPERAQPANALLRGGEVYLVDAGDGAAQQLAKAGLRLPQVKAVFLSHLHIDHTGGLAALIGLRDQTDVREVLTIYGPPGTRALVDGIVASLKPAAAAGYGIPGQRWPAPESIVRVVELAGGASVRVGDMTVRTAQNTHYDFAPGGADDRAYKSLSYRFDTPRRSIAYTGDTGPSPAVAALAKGADLLVSEMIDLDLTLARVAQNSPGMPAPARAKLVQHLSTHHLTPDAVGALAGSAGVKAVAVTHFAGGSDPARTADYRARIAKGFGGTIALANDLDRF
ncbi:MBL fold metallo-hydrolase [Sphingomonas spermidinifaciens]|uniref:MBL fold metallo-hydrolase n=1 Tax=Sphingomonas spermidinifaciens TaxID=1141889 RepID=A0A2A4B2Y8_9SPHN|nr:MBL fold metallo-hydrolase [Sphingomonas spermidinifaciens]PCD02054.1 MBL fold metallo-hydrolase [Sphingomonas spermidinifaciens]